MEKYIKADTVLRFINSCLEHEDKITDIEKAVLTGVKTCVERISPADVAEVRYCQFSLEEARRRESVYKCSACGNYLTVGTNTLNGGRGDLNYCPNCGAKKRREE